MSGEVEASTSQMDNQSRAHIGVKVNPILIRKPPWGYAHLQLIMSPHSTDAIDILTFRTHLTSALSRFLGLTGSAIPIDILKVEANEIWIRVPREDLSSVVAAVGGWVGVGIDGVMEMGWRVKSTGIWLSTLIGGESAQSIWAA